MLNSNIAHFTAGSRSTTTTKSGSKCNPFMLEDEYRAGSRLRNHLWRQFRLRSPKRTGYFSCSAYPSLENGLPPVVNHHDLVA